MAKKDGPRGDVPDRVLSSVPLSRRSFVKRLAAGAFALPVVSSFVLATRANAGEWSGGLNPAGHYPGWYYVSYPGGGNPAGNVPPGWDNANVTSGTRHRGGR